jgi:hypothetical protein
LHINGADGIGAHAKKKQAVGGLGHVESVEEGESLVGFSAEDVGLAGVVPYDSGNKVQNVAVIVGSRIRNIKDVQTGELLGGGSLRGIDAGWRLNDVHYFADFLKMGELDVNCRGLAYLHRRWRKSVETFLLDAELVATRD